MNPAVSIVYFSKKNRSVGMLHTEPQSYQIAVKFTDSAYTRFSRSSFDVRRSAVRVSMV